ILKRQRNYLEMARFELSLVKLQRDQVLQVTLPRREADLRESAERQTLSLDKTRSTLPLSLHKTRLDLEKQRYDLAKAKEKLGKLEHDAELMVVRAPAAGVVYYGACVDGEWSSASSMAE